MATILLLSQGVPMITAGDEFGRSQGGNNNAWCQDNPTSWVDWTLAETNQELLRFFRCCIHLRKKYQLFRRDDFFRHSHDQNLPAEISWQYLQPGHQNWAPDCHGLGFLLHGRQSDAIRESDFFIMINGHRSQSLTFTPPDIPGEQKGAAWFRIIDTAASTPDDFQAPCLTKTLSNSGTITVLPQAVVVLQSAPAGQPVPGDSSTAMACSSPGKTFGS